MLFLYPSAIDTASPGDVIHVSGTYVNPSGVINNVNKPVTIQGYRRTIGATTSQTQIFNLSKQAAGMYLIKVVTAGGVQTMKVVVQR